jgi:HEPN domain-containing protein
MFSSTSYAHLKLFKYIEITAYVIFAIAVISPSILLITIIINLCVHILTILPKQTLALISNTLSIMLAILTFIYTALKGYYIYIDKKKIALQEIEDEKIQELETARKLFEDGYYSQSILESYKVIENYFKKLLLEKQYISSHFKIYNILIPAEKSGLLKEGQKNKLYKINEMRNSAAHLNREFTKEQAIEALIIVEELIKGK